MSLRAELVRWHRRIALGAALFLLVQFLSGTVLVFREQLVALTLPAYGGVDAPFAQIEAAVLAAYPAAKPLKAEFPISSREAYLFHLSEAGTEFQVAVGRDGSNLVRLGAVANALEFLRVFHEDLTMGQFGRAIVCVEAIALASLLVTGGWIWWPGRGRLLRNLRLPTSGPAQAKLYGWHRTVGVVIGLLLIPSVITGFVLAIGGFLPPGKQAATPPVRTAIDNEARLALSYQLFPALDVREVRFDRATGTLSRVVLRDGHDGLRAPISDVNFDPRSGVVTQINDRHRNQGYGAFAAWGYPVHTAQIGGTKLRSLLLVTGVGAAALASLGLSLWWVRRTNKRKSSMRIAAVAAASFVALLATGAFAADAKPGKYTVVDQIDGPEGAWLFAGIDQDTRRLYIGRSDGFLAIDLDSKKTTQFPLDGKRVRGIASLPGGLVLGVTDKNNTATIIDGATGTVKGEVPVGRQPETTSYDPSSGLAVVMAVSADVTLIDPKQLKAVGSIPVAGILESNVPDGKGKVFVNLEDKNQIAVIDIAARKQVGSYELPGCKEPTGIAYDSKSGLLISACHNRVAKVIDAATGADRGTIQIAGGPDAVLIDEARRVAYVPCSEGYLTVIDLSGKTPKRVAQVPTAQGAHTGAVDTKTGKVYIPVGRAPATDFGARAVPGFAVLVVAAK
ncbi:MAG: gluconolactonase [Rhodospirillales bacterium]|jgi:uncharacterized iron-regulated membrane protein/DNA-binding beta-propeller fold protein YncE|nr:gluconolactonase [Rhodospirillales bacterium]